MYEKFSASRGFTDSVQMIAQYGEMWPQNMHFPWAETAFAAASGQTDRSVVAQESHARVSLAKSTLADRVVPANGQRIAI
jgi:hypothetical protein